MKIELKSGGHRILLLLPSRLIFSRLTVRIAEKYLQKKDIVFPPGAAKEFVLTVRKCRKYHKKLVLVDVESADGEKVKITL